MENKIYKLDATNYFVINNNSTTKDLVMGITKDEYDEIKERSKLLQTRDVHIASVDTTEQDYTAFCINNLNFKFKDILLFGKTTDVIEHRGVAIALARFIASSNVRRYIYKNYNKETNEVTADDQGTTSQIESFNDLEVFNQMIGRIGNPEYAIVVTVNNKEYVNRK